MDGEKSTKKSNRGRRIDLTGQRFERLLVLEYAGKDGKNNTKWKVRCDCGTEKVVLGLTLRGGSCRSCGCLIREVNSATQLDDLSGQRFGKLVVLSRATNRLTKSGRSEVCWNVRCDCGTEKVLMASTLKQGRTKGCGCVLAAIRHGQMNSLTYRSWQHMIRRCHTPTCDSYDDYGGRGISVCPQWQGEGGYQQFFTDMGERPSAQYSIDRYPDNDGNYEPGNCRWATMSQQALNKRSNVRLEFDGRVQTVKEWADETGLAPNTIRSRLKRGWSINDALSSGSPYGNSSKRGKQGGSKIVSPSVA